MMPDPAPTASSPDATNAANPTEHRFYLAPSTWFQQHVLPWLFYLPVAGGLLYFWVSEPHSTGAHAGFALAGLSASWVLYRVLTDKSETAIILDSQQISMTSGGSTTTLAYHDIKGFEEIIEKNVTYTLVKPISRQQSSLRIEGYFPDYAQIRKQLGQHMPDLNALERERHQRALAANTAQLLQNPALGLTPNERQQVLDRASGFVFWLNAAAMLLVFPLIFGWPYLLVMPLGLALPVLALAALWGYRGGIMRFFADPDDPRPDLVWTLGLTCVPLLLSNFFRFKFLTWLPLWPAIGGVAAGFALLLLVGSHRGPGPTGSALSQVGLGLLFALCYGVGAAVTYNTALQGVGVSRHVAYISGKYQTTGKGRSNRLLVNAWGPDDAITNLSVGRDYYARKRVGDSIMLRLRHGRLGADWVEVVGDN